MAELNQKTGGDNVAKGRKKKDAGKVDLTAMVDLAFLLITFFMLTTSLTKPQAMDVAMPDRDKTDVQSTIDVADNRTITLLLGSDNKILWYYGQLEKPIFPTAVVNYSRDGLRKVITEMKAEVLNRTKGKDLIVLIRPSDNSISRNLVDALDEMKIMDVKRYMISKINQNEIALLKDHQLYSE
ncbi:ExbD/TolR family protein [Sphingobacterium hungaricum]|uniref:Biopolymer transporter ExbD n=1 Tax=Sphingobacterium hungaricum TaxID=2082723 RepID=A0A928YQR2_9SPHI|nr:biopolymer transporter ExbD [Sphingobacterium hungaricum]MBE8714521.1 biopolymer transporter ExbD [Sphingobacterium hungaricum]